VKFLQDQFDKARPLFEKGGPLEALYPLFEAKETFMFTPGMRTTSGSHVRDRLDTKRLMSTVIAALIPTLVFGMYNVGYQHYTALGEAVHPLKAILLGARYVMPIVITSYAVGGIWELVFAIVRKHEINEGFLVTGMLFPLTLPPTIPLWQVAIGISFGVVIGKEVFGGTGMNIFNPALTARAFLYFAYPAQISGDKVWRAVDQSQVVDGYSGATPLGLVATHTADSAAQAVETFGGAARFADYSFFNSFIGLIPGSIGETSALMCLIGLAILLVHGVASWRIVLSCFIGALAMGGIMNIYAANGGNFTSYQDLPVGYHFVTGGFAFGAIFMATDPVSASQTNLGKWIYGFLIGVVTIIIRVINPAYPEGIMLAILFMNAFAPLIDHFVVQANVKRRKARVAVA
jgi:Na+-transporting NADH:ubiquinone oxidoreductase subunit B